MWNSNTQRHFLASNLMTNLGLTTAVVAVALALSPVSTNAATVFIQVTEDTSGHALCNVLCTQIVGGGPATQAPVALSKSTGQFINAAGEVAATTMKMSNSTNDAGNISLGLSDTFTVQGAGSGPVSLTAVWHATGTFGSVGLGSGNYLLGAVEIRIGTLGSFNVAGNTLYNIAKFASPDSSKITDPSNVFSNGGPFSFSADLTATHTFVADIGTTFDMAFGLATGFSFGASDFSHTATLSFLTPDGVYLTSGLGATFGDAPNAETPVPAALPLFATGLGVLGFVARRRKQKAVSSRSA